MMHPMVTHLPVRARLFLEREAAVTPAGLPAYVAPLIGRTSELAELTALVTHERVVTLTGSAGCGKTRLASELVARVGDRYPGGRVWVELASCSTDDDVLLAVAERLGVEQGPADVGLDRIAAALGDRPPVLIVLDNAEHLVAAVASVVHALAGANEHAVVLCTSREMLTVPGEVVWRVPSLPTPPLEQLERLTAAEIARFDAVALFVDRARRVRRGFFVTDANATSVAQICTRLDGSPLAIELAAARVRAMPPDRIAAQLDDRFRMLTDGSSVLHPRQQTLRASLEWSGGLLDDVERAVFRRLGVFMGGFTAAAAEAVIGSFGDVDPYDVADVVGRLVDKSLVQFDPERDRSSLLETVRSYALECLLDAGETAAAREAHAEWCASWLASVSRTVGVADVNSWWNSRLRLGELVDPEWPNCTRALDWTIPGTPLSLRLVAGLGDYWALRQRATDSARYGMPAVVHGDQEIDEWLDAVVALQTVRTNAADAEFGKLRDDAIALAAERGDRRSLLRLDLARHIAMVMLLGPKPDLLAGIDEVLAEATQLEEWYTVWNARQSPAVILGAAGRTLEADRRVADLTSARALLIRAVGAQMRGEYRRSDELAAGAQSMLDDRVGAVLDRVLVSFHAAGAAMVAGDASRLAGSMFEDTPDDQLPLPLRSARSIAHGVAELLEHRLDAARATFERAEVDVFPAWRILCFRAQIEAASGAFDEARRIAAHLRDISIDAAAPLYLTTAQLVLAECERETDPAAALDLAHQALDTAMGAHLWPAAIDALEAVGALLLDLERPRDAARVLAAAATERRSIGYHYRFPHRELYIAASSDQVAHRDGWAEGTTLSLAGAAEFARRMRGDRLRPIAGWQSLTPTERRVVEQVANGLTNPQIAQALLMSRSTVKTHLVHVYAKLRIGNRAELAAAVARRGGA